MSTSHNVPRKPIGSPSNEGAAPSEAQASLLPNHDSEEAFHKGQSLVAEKQTLRGVPGHNNGFYHSSSNTEKRRQYLRPIATWWQEALAIVLLLASLVASFATLYPYQGKPIPEWPYSITIGALLSLYSVILRLAATFLLSQGIAQSKWHWFSSGPRPLSDMVLHDNASRGPMGAFGLLFRLALPVTWQSLGCMLAIVALLVGPFTQQVLQYETCGVLDLGGEALISRTSAFMPDSDMMYLPLGEQTTMTAGFYSTVSAANSCSTGNCTFEPYTTVGYCSSCEDLSSRVEINKSIDIVPNVNNTFSSLLVEPNPLWDTRRNYTLSMNYTSIIPISELPWDAPVQKLTVATGAMVGDSYTVLIGSTERSWDSVTGIAPAVCLDAANETSWRCRGYGAARCSIYPCLRTYNSTITNGVLHERLIGVDTEALRMTARGTWYSNLTDVQAVLDLSCINENDRIVLRNRSYSVDADARWLPYNLGGYDGVLGPKFDAKDTAFLERGLIDRNCLFAISNVYTQFLQLFFDELHSGDLFGVVRFETEKAAINRMNGSQLLSSIWNRGDFSFERAESLFDNVTLSLTNYLRTNPGPPLSETYVRKDSRAPSTKENDESFIDATGLYSPAVGQAWTTKTCARIRWPWLILPAIVTIFTLVFYVGVFISARTLPKDVRTWKTSPLPFMFYSPGGTDESRQQEWFKANSQHVDDMDAAARKIYLRLDHDETGMAFFRKRGAVVDAERSSLTSGSDAVL